MKNMTHAILGVVHVEDVSERVIVGDGVLVRPVDVHLVEVEPVRVHQPRCRFVWNVYFQPW